jgi:hypothetical protein
MTDENVEKAENWGARPSYNPIDRYQSAKDALAGWDKGDIVWSITMGGLGPGYEQAIQLLIFELIRDLADLPLPAKGDRAAWSTWGDATVSRIDTGDNPALGFSGAQVGAAKSVAARALTVGWAKMLHEVPAERHTQVSRSWPHLPVPK